MAEQAKTEREKTAYQVLKLVDFPDVQDVAVTSGYMEVGGPVTAASAEAAIRAKCDPNNGGTYVAVPARSWNPVTVKAETKTVLKLT